MKLSSMLSVVVVILFAVGTAMAQFATPEYKSPITIKKIDVTYVVNADGTYTQESTGQIRVNTDQAVQSQGQTAIAYSESLQSLEVLEAYTETAEGEKVDVPADKIITQQSPLSVGAPAYDDVKIKVIVFPQISAGATKTYQYILKQTTPIFENHFFMFDMMPQSIDYESATITIIIPEEMKLHVQAIDIDGGPVESEIPGKSKYVWTVKNWIGKMPEQGAISEANYCPRLAVTTFADYREAAEAYLKRASDKEKVTEAVQKLADKITAGVESPRDQAAALYNWIAGNVRYVALGFGTGGVVPRNADTIIQTAYGDCKDKVVLLDALLAAKGIKSAPVLINAGDIYWLPDVALPVGLFNHAITYLPDFDLFVDPTAETAPFGILQSPEYGKYALVTRGLDKGPGIKMLPEPSPETSSIKTTTTVTIAEDGSAKGQSTVQTSGELEYALRSFKASMPQGQEAMVARVLLSRTGQQGEGNISGGDPRNLAEAMRYETEFTTQNVMMLPGPGAFMIPAGIPGPSTIAAMAFKNGLPEMKHASHQGGFEKVEITTVTVPENVKITHLPKDLSVQNEYGQYTATYKQDQQTIKVERRLIVKTPRGLCSPEKYPLIRELAQAIGRDFRSQVSYGE